MVDGDRLEDENEERVGLNCFGTGKERIKIKLLAGCDRIDNILSCVYVVKKMLLTNTFSFLFKSNWEISTFSISHLLTFLMISLCHSIFNFFFK